MMRFAIESWIWYTVVLGVLSARLISRTILFGSVKRLQYDDWIMGVFILASYTILIVMANIEARSHSNLLPPDFPVHELTPNERSRREYGSKIVVVVEQMQIAVIWSCKACLLILYYRLTRMVATKENVAIKLLGVYVALGFVVMEILYFGVWCRPFHNYWAVPTPNSQCAALTDHRITNAVFNISSDIIMLSIALPMFIRSLLPLKRKLILCCIFSLGVFVIIAAVLNKYYSFTSPYTPNWIFWYTRESSTAILVANLPFTWTLLRKLFNLGAFDDSAPPPRTFHSARTAGGRRTQRNRNSTVGGNGTGRGEKGTMTSSRISRMSHTTSGTSDESGATTSDSPTTKGSEKSDTPLVGWGDEESEGSKEKPDSWDVEAQRVLLAEPKKARVAPSVASSSRSVERRRLSGGGGGGGRSARDRKIRAQYSK
ncbi:uncharacterized protein K441DRAFT_355767 [Cenococcum geophilum 1.58]|uniref:uncharacterized protein n=1 Tax=Cenococcum geophilum 1.58 TaxID=794803 RepID=UPI000DC819DB|nr:hypothetical protein K441DRAFT_355767 [Cenococcum geophilum 1.58]